MFLAPRIAMFATAGFRCYVSVAMTLVLALPTLLMASGGGSKKPAGHGPAKSAHGAGHAPKGSHGAVAKGSHAPAKSGHGAAKEASHDTKADEERDDALAPDYEELLSMISVKEKKHDPRLYVEIDLGSFKVTHPGPDKGDYLVKVKFHIFGVLPEQEQLDLEKSLEGRQQRMRDAVLSVVQRTHFDQLNDPALDAVKSELVASINRVLETNTLRDIAFSNFSMERD
jgi:hypothetical protein